MPSGEGEREGLPPLVIAVVAGILILRLFVGGLTHLTEDEAYYRLWSMAPALGYYDHPPMVAWWIWLGRHIAGDNALGVRLLPILSSAAISVLVFEMAKLAGASREVAGRACLWFNATILVLDGGFLAVPDAPASLFWSLSLWCALIARRGRPLRWWAAAGLAAGLAALSKYSALFIAPGMVLWLAWTPDGRAQLKTVGPWLAAVIAVAIFALNVGWNAQHHWLTFARQFGRVTPHQFAPRYLLELLVGQTLLLNPLIAMFAFAGAFIRPRDGARGASLTPFLTLCAPFLAYLVFHSLHDRVQAHWPAPLYPLLSICAAVGAERLGDGWRRARLATPIVGFALGAVTLVMLAAPGRMLGRYDLALPVRGWTPFAARLEAMRQNTGATWIGTTSYGLDSQLADEPTLHAPVLQLTQRDRWSGLTIGPPPSLSGPGLVVDLTRRVTGASLARCFTRVEPLGVISRGDPGEPGKPYAAFLVQGPKRDILTSGC